MSSSHAAKIRSRVGAGIAASRRARVFTVAVVAVLLAGSSAVGVTAVGVSAASAAPATSTSCGFATPGTGTFASTICWFNMAGFDQPQAAAGQLFSISIAGGYTLSFTLASTGGAVHATTFPTYGGAYLGNNGHYSGVPGSPALYQSQSGTTTTATLTNISLTSPLGTPQTGFALVGADAESTDGGESLSWTSSAPISSLTATSTGTGLGNACGGGFTGTGTTTVTCKGTSSGTKTGTAIVSSSSPTTFSQTMVGAGLEAFSFGVLLSSVQLNKTVVNGYAGDAFKVSIADGTGGILATANTGGGSTATTGPTTVVVDPAGSTFNFSEAATSGAIANYTPSWACTRNGATDSTLPSGNPGTSAGVTVGVGDAVVCTITNTGLPRGLSLVKHAGTPIDVNGDGLLDAGDQIPYTFTVTNTGQVAMQGLQVNDPKLGAVTCPRTSLDPGDSETCAAAALYTVTAGDVTAGSVENTATVSGHAPNNTETITSAPSSTSTPTVAPAPGLSVVKSASPSAAASYVAGQQITYSFVVTNAGNVTVADIAIDEGSFSGTGIMSAATCPAASLTAGAQEVCTATYTLTQADVDAGSVTNTATGTGTPTGSGTPIDSPPASVTVPTPAQPGISVAKTASPGTATAAGQTITYSFHVTDTGNVDLSAIAIDEGSFSGTGTLSAATCPDPTLVAGQVETCTATYTTTQADVNTGTLTNTATATGTPPDGVSITSGPANATVTIVRDPAMTVNKTADAPSVATGGNVTYSFLVTNTGNVTLTDPVITDSGFTGHGTLGPITCPAGTTTLQPGDRITCTADYTAVQADVDAGSIANSATVTGTPPAGLTPPTSDPSTVAVGTSPAPALTLVKSADRTGVTSAGQTVDYTFTVTNTGNVTVTNPTIDEGRFTGHGQLSTVTCPSGSSTLAPGDTMICTATYTVVAADLTSSTLSNTATAAGALSGGGTITSDPSTVTVSDAPATGLARVLGYTGSDLPWPVAIIALALMLLGGALIYLRHHIGRRAS
jgi:hypothetical protein